MVVLGVVEGTGLARGAGVRRDLPEAELIEQRLRDSGYGDISTEIVEAPDFYYAEDYHQQYLAKNPYGYCPVLATGVSCPVGLFAPTN